MQSTLTTIDKISITLHQKLYAELNADQRGSVEEIFFGPISGLLAFQDLSQDTIDYGHSTLSNFH